MRAQLLQVLIIHIKLLHQPQFSQLQMQMLQGLSGLSQAQGGLTNPLLYYTYYTQVTSSL